MSYLPFFLFTVVIESDPVSFLEYSLSDALFNKLAQVCQYVETNRNSLYISTQWNYQRDCISNQLGRANQTLMALPSEDLQAFLLPYWGAYAKQNLYISSYWNQIILLYWAYSFGQESFLGVSEVTYKAPYLDVLAPIAMPVWVCANFSMQDPNAFTIQNNLVNARVNTWNSIFSSSAATQLKVNSIVGSPSFSTPIFESAVSTAVALGAVASIFGFIALVALLTQNISSTVICTFSVFSICLIVVAIKLGTISNTFDLYDAIVLVTCFALFANFPMHFFFHFFNDSDHLRILYYKTEDYEDEFDLLWNLPNSLMYTARYSLRAFLVPFLMVVAIGAYLLTSQLLIIQRTGQYLVIISIVSFVYTLTLFPFSLALSVRLAKYDVDYDEKIENAKLNMYDKCDTVSQWISDSIHVAITSVYKALIYCVPVRSAAVKAGPSDKYDGGRSNKVVIIRNRAVNNDEGDGGSVGCEEGEPFALDIEDMDDDFDESPVQVTTSGKMMSQSGKWFGSPTAQRSSRNLNLGSNKNFSMSPRSAGTGGGSSKKMHPTRAHMHGRDRNVVLLELSSFNLERYTRETALKTESTILETRSNVSETKSTGGKEVKAVEISSTTALSFAMKRFLEQSVASTQQTSTNRPQLKKSSSQRIREKFAEIDAETKKAHAVDKTLREYGEENEPIITNKPNSVMSLFEASFLLPANAITPADKPIVSLRPSMKKRTADETTIATKSVETQPSMAALFAFLSPRSADAAKLKRFADSLKDDVDSSHQEDLDPATLANTQSNAVPRTVASAENADATAGSLHSSHSNSKSPRGSTLTRLFENSFFGNNSRSSSPRAIPETGVVMKPSTTLNTENNTTNEIGISGSHPSAISDKANSTKYTVIPSMDASSSSLPTETSNVPLSVVEHSGESDNLVQPDGESVALSDHEKL